MAAIPMVMMLGAGMSAVGAISQANATKAASSYNAQLREMDAGDAGARESPGRVRGVGGGDG
jgi:hypothetical protein